MKNLNIVKYLRQFAIGLSMGAADLVPGVSGGTVAFISGIYEDLLGSIATVTSEVPQLALKGKIKEAWEKIPFGFLVPLAFGMATSILLLSHTLEMLLEKQPVLIWSFFFGLVLSSIFIVRKTVKKWNAKLYLSMVIGAIATYIVVGMVPVMTPATPLAFFLSGMVAICAMILPGISGSFLLVIMGKYEQVLAAVNDRDFLTVIYVGFGAIFGLVLFSRLLKFLLKNYHNVTIAALVGVLIGSLRKVWPWKIAATQQNLIPEFSIELLAAIFLMVLGAIVVTGITKLGSRARQS
ncbi:MAG: DUF368 domain-containing protein [Candidatus Pacebacteria bacterium CG10_big_fil_rev_8_21_14_0_10_42_12]|nr:DUF368 domain-containing protein [Candidatus Paceibacterota bacterium]PIR62846.1 MAG: DUF368 domain-containing protein [Candidatus Pacebacteria bacterium CG10_big_fil_rev_8_21_14_0_10_42_12]